MSEGEVSHLQNQEAKLEDILKSIRGVIDNHNKILKTEVRAAGAEPEEKEEQVLELTSVFSSIELDLDNKENSELISEGAKLEAISKLKDFTRKLDQKESLSESKTENLIDNMARSIMKPLIKEWLDNNLSKIVEKVISEEIKQLMPKKN